MTGSNEPGYSAMRDINPSTPPWAALQAGPVPAPCAKLRIFIFRKPLNHLPACGVSLGEPAVFRPEVGDETQRRRDETIFGLREGTRKRALGINASTKRWAATAHDRGPS